MWYLCVFYHRLLDYRKPEFESLADLFGAFGDTDPEATNKSLEWRLPLHHHPDSPFHYVNLPSEDIARNIANRSQYPLPSLSLYASPSLLVAVGLIPSFTFLRLLSLAIYCTTLYLVKL